MNDVNFSKCKFNGEMVSYMYGELSSDETSVFERHLVDCAECTDEFAAISSSRYEVYDWKKLEFDPLETPVFEVPLGETAGVSWSEKIRAVFARGWAVPTVSFAALAIVSVAVAGLILRQGNNVEDLSKNVSPVTESSAPVASNVPNTSVDTVSKPTPPVGPTTTQASQSKRAVSKSTSAQAVKASRARPLEVKQTTAKNEQRPVPTLNEYPDDEDTSLRLAELLDDIGSR